jgi:hypothetical protein
LAQPGIDAARGKIEDELPVAELLWGQTGALPIEEPLPQLGVLHLAPQPYNGLPGASGKDPPDDEVAIPIQT